MTNNHSLFEQISTSIFQRKVEVTPKHVLAEHAKCVKAYDNTS